LAVQKVEEIIYRGKCQIHDIRPGQPVFVFIHQTHAGEPYMNTFSVSAYPLTDDMKITNLLLERLIKKKENLHGYSRILKAELMD
jgi:hypothetical protein